MVIEDNFLILVDQDDNSWGKLEKSLVHRLGLLHRAFSVFIFNQNGELLLQQRAEEKYHSGGLWTNTCCSHPVPGEDVADAINRRMQEEMGLKCRTSFAFKFTYQAHLNNNMIENEIDHVYIGISDELPHPEKTEVKDWKYLSLESVRTELNLNPDAYTYWFQVIFEKVADHYHRHYSEPMLMKQVDENNFLT